MPEPTYTVTQIKALVDALGLDLARKNDPASTTLTAPALHGPFQGNANQWGIFTEPGVRPDMFSTLVRPRSLASLLTLNRSRYTRELLEVMTGVTAAAGTNATGFCGDPPTVGQGKVCEQIYSWGNFYVKTDLNSLPQTGELRDRSDVPRNIMNAAPENRNPLVPSLMYSLDDTQRTLRYELWRIGVELERTLEHVLVQGDPTLGSANTSHGWIAEFSGIDKQIKTGYTDAKTGFACAAMDSIVISFNAAVDGTIGGGDGRNAIQALSDLIYAAQDRAAEMGMDGVMWAFVMRKEHFRALVDVMACQYATYRCDSTANPNATLNEDVQAVNELRLSMMRGQYLLIEGIQWPVIFSEGIQRDSLGSNMFKSDMYFVPIAWQGMPLLRLEYFPMDNEPLSEFASFVTEDKVRTLNNGFYIVGYRDTGLCIEYHFAARMRAILETPFLAGRIDDMRYTFQADIRNALPGDTFFYADGGRTYRSFS